MDIFEAMSARHAVRKYTDKELSAEVIEALEREIEKCNHEGGLRMKLVVNREKAFGGFFSHYGLFSGVRNYLAMIGPDKEETGEKLGYYGERIVLLAQRLGLNSCWVGATYKKSACGKTCEVKDGEKLFCVVALGYGRTQGAPHKNKPTEEICLLPQDAPEWFLRGVRAAMLAPTALNKQQFKIEYDEDGVTIWQPRGSYSDLDVGIVKCHFEFGAGKENFRWAE